MSTRRVVTAAGARRAPLATTGEMPAREGALEAALPTAAPAGDGRSLIDRALAFVQTEQAALGFGPQDVVEFVPDPTVQQTSSGSSVVHLHQQYRGVPVLQMTRTVRFSPESQITDAIGDNLPIPAGFCTEPRVPVTEAVLTAAQYLASTGSGQTYTDEFKQVQTLPTIELGDYQPGIVAAFALPSRPTVLEKGPFENVISAHLTIVNQPDGPRLAWYAVLTFPDYVDQYVAIVSADKRPAEVLYCKSTLHAVQAQGNVYEWNPGTADRRMVRFPRPLEDYPMMPTAPIAAFPCDWVSGTHTLGNSTCAILSFGQMPLDGKLQDGTVVFDPQDPESDDQKLLNVFYFCNYMHDFLYILGFDERAGNFQEVNFTHTGRSHDAVRVRVYSGEIPGGACIFTGPDGMAPLMKMGLIGTTGRHTALDADVVLHEYSHGMASRLAGGPVDVESLQMLQSAGMSEGWADFFALTLHSFFRGQEKTVLGDWVAHDPKGIRRAPYDDNYPFHYGQLRDSAEVHTIGEVWCATLMRMTRRIRAALGDDRTGYRLAWMIVVDALHLTTSNPTFLEGRDDILRAIDDMESTERISAEIATKARHAVWDAFAHFGMGIHACSEDSNDVANIVADFTMPANV